MTTPIFDFVKSYADKNPVRAHMPGHKGRGIFDAYKYDITEIDGADYLSEACGIIGESEKNASLLFGCDTFYSTEGSSLCIRAMLFMIKKKAECEKRIPRILAGRNAHASFVNACALLEIDVDWIMPLKSESYESCTITAEDVENCLSGKDALYITSPDYLGNVSDIAGLAEICHRHGILLIVDNAHGAYLKFLDRSLFPIDLGADMCCSSAHKTLPVLTGGAYLHINGNADSFFEKNARQALSIFASSSPSYLILQSLDLCNDFLENEAIKKKAFIKTAERVSRLKNSLKESGFTLVGDEPLKLTIKFSNNRDILGIDCYPADILKDEGIYVEYHDSNHLVMMFSPLNTEEEYERIESAFKKLSGEKYSTESDTNLNIDRERDQDKNQGNSLENNNRERMLKPVQSMDFKSAMLAASEYVEAKDSIGRIMARPVLSCPPCVPIYMYGEVIGEDILKYCTGKVAVVKK